MDKNEILIQTINRLGITGRALATALGITERTMYDYTNHHRVPSERTMKRLKEYLSKLEVVEAVRSEKEAHLLFMYRNLIPADQATVDSVTDALYFKSAAGTPLPPPPT
jgi:transcriptional regulator with XRE-family HTH domain